MTRWTLCIGLTVLTLTLAAYAKTPAAKPAPATEPAPASAPAKDLLGGPYWGAMVKELKLDEPDQAKLLEKIREKVQAKVDALTDFDNSQDGKELVRLNKERDAAVVAKDTAKAKALTVKINPLKAQRKKIDIEKRADALALLNDKQLTVWQGYCLYVSLSRYFGKAKLTGEQKKELREMCRKAAPDFAKIDTREPKTQAKFRRELIQKAHEEIKWQPQQIYALEGGGSKPTTRKHPATGASEDE